MVKLHLVAITQMRFRFDSCLSHLIKMKILIACEESQRVCIEFRKLGFEAFSCDIQECSGEHPEWHIQGNVLDYLDLGWDLMIAFPPCTYLSKAGNKWKNMPGRSKKTQEAFEFFMELFNSKIPLIAIENPVGYMSSMFRKPDQIIQPYYFGDLEHKPTCLWLKNLPSLTFPPENKDKKPEPKYICKNGKRIYWSDSFSGKDKNRSKKKSKTFQGIARAMAKQWGDFLKIRYHKKKYN